MSEKDLLDACKDGQLELVEELLKLGISANTKSEQNLRGSSKNALIYTFRCDNHDVLQLLVKYGADVHYQDENGHGLLFYAAYNGATRCLRLLIEEYHLDANVTNEQFTSSPLLAAAIEGRLGCVRELLKHGANMNIQSSLGVSPLMCAANKGHIFVVKELLKAGANTSLISNNDGTAYEMAKPNIKEYFLKVQKLIILVIHRDRISKNGHNGPRTWLPTELIRRIAEMY
jgi:ankyrin repeat protein